MIDIHAKTSKQNTYTMSQLTHTKQIVNYPSHMPNGYKKM
jgi:hypothetical protein